MSNWSEAAKNGEKHYFTCKPCKRGHVALRFTKGGGCVDCNYIRLMRYSNNLDHLTDEQILAKRGEFKPKPEKAASCTPSVSKPNSTKTLNEVFYE